MQTYIITTTRKLDAQQAYVKASNTGASDAFGETVTISGDTMVVGAFAEQSNATGINGDQANDTASSYGAAYVFVQSGSTGVQQAYLKATNSDASDNFGSDIAISDDTIVIGAYYEDSDATGVTSGAVLPKQAIY